jgi:hypothetical protein
MGLAYISESAYKYIRMGLYKCLNYLDLHNSQHGNMIQHMKGGVGGNLAGGKLYVTLFTTVIILFKRGGVCVL